MDPRADLLFNFHEFRTGLWLPKAYVVARDDRGRPARIQEAARAASLGLYGIPPSPAVARCLELAAQLNPRHIAEAHRRGSKKMPTLAGLIAPGHRDREAVVRYVHKRSAELLRLCRETNLYVTINMNSRAVVHEHLAPFAPTPLEPHLHLELSGDRLLYRLTIAGATGNAARLRHHDLRVLTNRPAPGWLQVDGELRQLAHLNGDRVRPFLSRDTVEIPADSIGQYFRDFVSRAALRAPLSVSGFEYREITSPDGLHLTARPHPFEDRYLLYPSLRYGERLFPFADPDQTAVDYATRPPYYLRRYVRDFDREGELLAPLLVLGLRREEGAAALLPQPGSRGPAPLDALHWLLANQERLRELGIAVDQPTEDGRRFTSLSGTISLDLREESDWLDLRATVLVGPHRIPFAQLVRHIQRGDRRYVLPDGDIFLIPEEWFARYAGGLAFARVEGQRVRLARSHAPLVREMGVETGGDAGAAIAEAYRPGPELRATLRPYQLAGARWLVRHYHEQLGACLADDMGLGKTLQTIAVLVYAKERAGRVTTAAESRAGQQIDLFGGGAADEDFLRPLRALVVLPASLVFNWRAELARFAPHLTVKVNTGTKRDRDPAVLRRFDVLLTTYQTALRDAAVLGRIDWEYIVLDESQQIKNRQSKVFRALNELSANHRISLSGTPIENSLSDLWSQMQFINPGLLRSYAFFKKHFITPIEVHDDERRKAELRNLVRPHLLRRTKAEVAPDLPELDVQLFYCGMTKAQRRAYEAEKSAARNALLGAHQPGDGAYKLRVIQTLTRLRQLANHPVLAEEDYDRDSGKFAEVLEQWDTVRRSGQKVLIFSSMVRYLELFRSELAARAQPYAWISGATSGEQRAREVARFQEDPAVQTFLISIKAGGTGLNLTAADYVFILDPWWNPTIEEQAIARAHRIGRRGNVFARKFLSEDSIEEKINLLQQRKRQLAEDIIGGGGLPDFDRAELEFLLAP